MEQNNTPSPTPKPSEPTPEDATEASDEQRELQDKLDHQNDDPEAPAGWQTRNEIPDEN